MITDDELSNLPADPELAFVAIEKILRQRVSEYEAQARNNDESADQAYHEYMTRTSASAKIFKIEALSGLTIPPVSARSIYDDYRQFTSEVDFVTMQIRISAATVNREGSVELDQKMKRTIHHYIQQIRDLIEAAELEPEKKEALLNKLNKFASEVDKPRTNLQAAAAIFISVCSGIGDGFEKLKPVRDMLDSVARVLGKAKDLEDHYSPRLPSPEDRKRIPPPPRSPEPQNATLDHDIPF